MISEIVDDLSGCEQVVNAWKELVASGSSQVFTSPHWAVSAWRHFPDLGSPKLISVSSIDGQLLGLMPLAERGGLVKWAGSPLGDEHDLQVHPSASMPTVAHALVVKAGEVADNHRRLTLHDVRPNGLLAGLGHTTRGCPAPRLPLRGPDRDFGSLACIPGWSRDRRRGLRSRHENLNGAGTVRIEHLGEPTELIEALPSFVHVRLNAWRQRGRFDELPIMDRHANFAAFLTDAAAGLGAVGQCILRRLLIGQRPIAQALYFRTNTTDLLYMSTFDQEFARYSPSHLLLAATAERCWEEGRLSIELGRGDEAYKFDLGATEGYLEDVTI